MNKMGHDLIWVIKAHKYNRDSSVYFNLIN